MLTDVEPMVVIQVAGELDLDNQAQLEKSVLERLTVASVVLDCSALDFLSISALRSLQGCANAAEAGGRHFVLAHPSRQVRRLLALAHMEHLLQCSPGR